MGKWSNFGGKFSGGVSKPFYTPKWHFSRPRNFFSKKNFDTGFGINSVGIPGISPYTKSEQPRIAKKNLTRHAKKGYAVVGLLIF